MYSPRTLSTLVPKIIRPLFKRRGMHAADLLNDWPQIVGQNWGQNTFPLKIYRGILQIGVTQSNIVMLLKYMDQQIIERVNIYLGHQVVKQIRFRHMQQSPVEEPDTTPSSSSGAMSTATTVEEALATLKDTMQKKKQ